MKLLRLLLRRSRSSLALAVLMGAASGGASTALLAAVNSSLTAEGPLAGSFYWRFFALCLLASLATVASAFLLQRLGQAAVLELRLRLAREILATRLERLEELGPASLLTILTDDIGLISGTIVLVPVMAINCTIVVGALAYLAWLSPRLFLGFLALLALGVVTYLLPLRRGLARFERVRRIQETLLEHLRGVVEGIKELKLHGERRGAFLGSLDAAGDEQRRQQIAGNMIFVVTTAWGHLLIFLVIGGLLIARAGLGGLESGVLLSYVVVILYMTAPLQVVLNSLPQLGRAGVSVARIEELGLSLAPQPQGPALPEPARAEGWNELRLVGVTHRHRAAAEHESFVLGPVDLALGRGELVIVAGGNGSGKTTLAKLLVGLYAAEGGEILLDGRRVDAADLEGYRALFSVVFSDFYLFPSLLGLPAEGLDERAGGYLDRLQLQGKVTVESGRLSTTSLSQGQRKRLALLTAYLEDRPIYLFDEWAADQDPIFKQVFYQALLPELKRRGKTLVVISHDEDYYGVADRLIKLADGRIESDTVLAASPSPPARRALSGALAGASRGGP